MFLLTAFSIGPTCGIQWMARFLILAELCAYLIEHKIILFITLLQFSSSFLLLKALTSDCICILTISKFETFHVASLVFSQLFSEVFYFILMLKNLDFCLASQTLFFWVMILATQLAHKVHHLFLQS